MVENRVNDWNLICALFIGNHLNEVLDIRLLLRVVETGIVPVLRLSQSHFMNVHEPML